MLQKKTMTDPAGTVEKALERNLLNVEHDPPLPLIDLTLGEVHGCPSNLNKTRIPRRWKCSWRVCPMHPLKGWGLLRQVHDRIVDSNSHLSHKFEIECFHCVR